MRKTSNAICQSYETPVIEGIDICVCSTRAILLADSNQTIIKYGDFTEEEEL